MNKLVYGVFKAIAVSMILVFVFDMAMYLYKAISIDQRMKNLMTSMQQTVSENNYLPTDAYNTYVTMFKSIGQQMMGANGDYFTGDAGTGKRGFFLNYGHDAQGVSASSVPVGSQGIAVHTDMANPAEYGDIMIVQAAVRIQQPHWGFTTVNSNGESVGAGGERGAAAFQNDRTSSALKPNYTIFTYTYFVPCMNYSRNSN